MRFERGLGRPCPTDVVVTRPRVRSVGTQREKSAFDKRPEHGLAHHAVDAAQALDLLAFQTQAGHFDVLGSDAIDDKRVENWIHNTPDIASLTRRISLAS